MDKISINVIEKTLSDGSKVYDVHLTDGEHTIQFNCDSESEAYKVAELLKNDIVKHTINAVD